VGRTLTIDSLGINTIIPNNNNKNTNIAIDHKILIYYTFITTISIPMPLFISNISTIRYTKYVVTCVTFHYFLINSKFPNQFFKTEREFFYKDITHKQNINNYSDETLI